MVRRRRILAFLLTASTLAACADDPVPQTAANHAQKFQSWRVVVFGTDPTTAQLIQTEVQNQILQRKIATSIVTNGDAVDHILEIQVLNHYRSLAGGAVAHRSKRAAETIQATERIRDGWHNILTEEDSFAIPSDDLAAAKSAAGDAGDPIAVFALQTAVAIDTATMALKKHQTSN